MIFQVAQQIAIHLFRARLQRDPPRLRPAGEQGFQGGRDTIANGE
jgi:hypothetical protein